jgi:hypothetical protein
MSVVEKPAPRWRPVATVGGVVTALIALIAVVLTVADDTSGPAAVAPSTTRGASSEPSSSVTSPLRVTPLDIDLDRTASYRVYLQRGGAEPFVFAYVDPQRGEIRHLDDAQTPPAGRVVGRFADRLVLATSRVRLVDRDMATEPVWLHGDEYIGSWRDHAIVAEYFPERTTFHQYDRDGVEVRSVALVGRRPDVMGGVVGDSVVVERAGRLLSLGLSDATVRPFGVGHLLGVGGDRVFHTTCSTEGVCTINEVTVDRGIVRTTPIGDYVSSGSDRIFADVAPNGLAIYLHDYRRGQDVVLALGTTVVLPSSIETRSRAWAPSGDWIFSFDDETDTLEAIDFRGGHAVTIPLSRADAAALAGISVW